MKTYTHDELSAKAAAWVHARTTRSGLRSGFEVSLAPGYVADFAALGWWGAQHCREWGIYGDLRRVEMTEGDYTYEVIEHDRSPDVRSLLFVVEAKATRADFLSTFNESEHHANRKEAVGSLHWIATNRGICDPSEVPGFWGLLEPRGAGMREMKRASYHETTEEIVNQCAYILLWKKSTGRIGEVIRTLVLASEETD